MRKMITSMLLVLMVLPTISVAWAWEIERPSDLISINERIEKSETNGEASVGLGVAINNYNENFGDYGGADFVNMNISVTANSRRGIVYSMEVDAHFRWRPPSSLSNRSIFQNVGDEWGCWVSFPDYFLFRLYGGHCSAVYERVYVSSNGFLCFDNHTASTCPHPPLLWPSNTAPNSVVAPLWTDLVVDSAASIITGLYQEGTIQEFVVIWNHTRHKASGVRLTFQAILGNAPMYYPASTRYRQSTVWFSYQSVSNINTNFAFGIEDQEGLKGNGHVAPGNLLGNHNGKTLRHYQSSNSYFLKRLTINFTDSNHQTRIYICTMNEMIRGLNIERDPAKPSEPDTNLRWVWVLSQAGVMLLGKSGIMLGAFFFVIGAADTLAYNQYSGRKVSISHGSHTANITAQTLDHRVDASLCIVVHWVFDTAHTATHQLTITASAIYDEYDGATYTEKSILTSVNLKTGPDSNNSFPTARTIQPSTEYTRLYLSQPISLGGYDTQDFYQIFVPQDYTIVVYAEATPKGGIQPDFTLHLYDPNQNPKNSTSHGYSHVLSYTADSTGYWFIEARTYVNHGFYKLRAEVHGSGGGGGGGGEPPLLESLPEPELLNENPTIGCALGR